MLDGRVITGSMMQRLNSGKERLRNMMVFHGCGCSLSSAHFAGRRPGRVCLGSARGAARSPCGDSGPISSRICSRWATQARVVRSVRCEWNSSLMATASGTTPPAAPPLGGALAADSRDVVAHVGVDREVRRDSAPNGCGRSCCASTHVLRPGSKWGCAGHGAVDSRRPFVSTKRRLRASCRVHGPAPGVSVIAAGTTGV